MPSSYGLAPLLSAVVLISGVVKGATTGELSHVVYARYPLPGDAARVNMLTGVLHAVFADMSVGAGPLALDVNRAYDAEANAPGLLGRRWRLNWERRVLRRGDLAGIRESDRAVLLRRVAQSDLYRSGEGDTLQFSASGSVRTTREGAKESYDTTGRLVEVDGRNGNLVKLTYDSSGRLSRVDGPFNSFLKFVTDDQGRLIEVQSSTGDRVRYFYQGQTPPSEAAGRQISYRYDERGLLTAWTHPRSGAVEVKHDAYGRVTERRFADGAADRYEYDDAAHTVKRTDPAGRTTLTRQAANGSSVEYIAGSRRSRVEFDAAGRPALLSGPTGLTSRLTYDAQGRAAAAENQDQGTSRIEYLADSWSVAALTDPAGRRLSLRRDAQQNLQAVKRDDGPTNDFEFTYLSNGLVETARLAGGRELSFTYDLRGRLESVSDQAGHRGRFEYDAQDRLVRYTDPAGHVIQRSYNAEGLLAGMVDSLGAATRYEYNQAGLLVGSVDAMQGATSFEYDARGRLTSTTDPLGRRTRLAHYPDGRLMSRTDPAGNITRYDYDADGRLLRRLNPSGGATSHRYDALGRRIETQRADGATTRFTNDALGRLVERIDPSGNAIHLEYDRLGRLVTRTDAFGKKTQFEYDRRGNLTKIAGPEGRVITRKYDDADRLVEVAVDDKAWTAYKYDKAGNVTRSKQAAGLETSYQCDAYGRITEWHDNAGGGGKAVYDSEGRLLEYVDATGAATRCRYDALGRLLSVTDALGRVQARSYDAAGQLIEVVEPNGDRAQYEYDPAGRIAKVRLPGDGEKTYRYNAVGCPLQATDPLGRASRSTYDAAGRLLSMADAQGRKTTRSYDAAGRTSEMRLADGAAIRYRYDKQGRTSDIDDGAFPVRYAHDNQGRLTAVEYPAIKQTVHYAYDARSRLESVMFGGQVVRYAYDEFDRLAAIDLGQSPIKLGYDARGRRTSMEYPNGVRCTREFDAAGRVMKLVYTDREGKAIAGGGYVYDVAGNETETTGVDGNATRYLYDPAGQLVEEDRPAGGRTTYAYGPGGNRIRIESGADKIEYQYDKADQMLAAGPESFKYDEAGNLVQRSGPQGMTRYAYDAANRLAKVELADGRQVSYGYAPTGQRVWREEAGNRTWYLGDGVEVLAELDGDLKTQATFVHGPGIDDVLAMTRGGKTYFLHPDRRGSVRSVTDAGGSVVAVYDYDAFGRILSKQGDAFSPFTFTGREFDETTGLYCFRARWYDPAQGRFLTKDPVAAPQTEPLALNPYCYVANNPLRRIDPLGAEGVNPNITMDSPPAATAGSPPAVTIDTPTPPPELAPTVSVPPELAPTLEVPTPGPPPTLDTPAGPAATFDSPAGPAATFDSPARPPSMRPIEVKTISGPVSPFQIDIMMRNLLFDPETGNWGTKQDIINFLEVFKAQGHYDPGNIDTVIENVRSGKYDPFWEGMFHKPGGAPPGTTGPIPEPAPPQVATPSAAAEAPMPSPVAQVAATEEAGLWTRMANGARGAFQSFMEPKVSTGSVASGVAGGSLVAGNIIIDVYGDNMTLGESLKAQAKGLILGIPIMLGAMATGTGEVLLVVGTAATLKRGYDALSGEATVFALDPKASKRMRELLSSGRFHDVLSGRPPNEEDFGGLADANKARPLTPKETADLLHYLEGLSDPNAGLVRVPSVIGYPLQSALPTLIQAGFAGRPIVGKDAQTEKQQYQVYHQSPAGDTMAAAGSTVDVMFYNKKGMEKELVKVPNLITLTKDEAEKLLGDPKLKLKGKPAAGDKRPSPSNKRQEVYEQSPQADTEVAVGETVSFTYYAGIPVGRYIGLMKDQAMEKIKQDQLTPKVEEGEAMTEDLAERYIVYQQTPQPGEYVWFGDAVDARYYKFDEGFRPGDGAKVDPRFASAQVSDGLPAEMKGNTAGKRGVITFFAGAQGGNETQGRVGWSIIRYSDAAGARQAFDDGAKLYPETRSSPYFRSERTIGGNSAEFTSELHTDRNQATAHGRLAIYRGQFLINYGFITPQSGADVSHGAAIIEKSKKLIDLRFPRD